MTFYDYTLALDGSISSRRSHHTEKLDQAAVQMFKEMLQEHGNNFRKVVPVDDPADIELAWLSESHAALGAFSLAASMVTISAFLSGREPEADTRVLNYFREILGEEAQHRALPTSHLAGISERPLVLSIPLPTFRPWDMALIGKLEVSLAAAFFQQR